MGQLILFFIILYLIRSALKNIYFTFLLVLLCLMAAPVGLLALPVVLFFLYKNEKAQLWLYLYREKIKLKQRAKESKRRNLRSDIEDFKQQAINKIERKYNCSISIDGKKVDFVNFNHAQVDLHKQSINELEQSIDEKRKLIQLLKDTMRQEC